MSEGRLARRYARALFSIAQEADALDAYQAQLGSIAEALEASPELNDLLVAPDQPADLRRGVFVEAADKLGVGADVKNTVQLLIDRGRMALFLELVAEVNALVDEAHGRVRGEVVTAGPLADDQREALTQKLRAITGREVVLTVREDPSLIGGLVARVGDKVFDASIRSRLDGLKRAVLEERV